MASSSTSLTREPYTKIIRTSGAEKADDIVQPGHTYTYRWTVPEHVGPTTADAQCVTWLYYSSVDPVKDTYSGESPVLSYSL